MNTKLKTFLLSSLLFLNSFLIFAIQPIFAKDLLPLFGGSAGVWNVSCFFFQLLLLGGYIYAHKIHRHLTIHMLMLCTALLFLPFTFEAINAGSPALSIIATLMASVGLVYFLISSTAPLVQRISGLENPYALYSASNMGAIAALMSYPILIESVLSRTTQKGVLSAIAGIVIVSMLVLAFVSGGKKKPIESFPPASEKVSAKKSWFWILLAFIPSSLMLGVTEYISSEMFVVPLFWIIPLGLYFLSFVIAFGRKQKNFIEFPLMIMLPILFMTMSAIDTNGAEGIKGFLIMGFHLAVFFYTALVFHTKLAKNAPKLEHLTWFYVCLSIGGALGGFFNSIIAPIIFSTYFEYPLILIVSVLLLLKNKKMFTIMSVFVCIIVQASRFTNGDEYHKVSRYRNFYGVIKIQENPRYTAMLMTGLAMHGFQLKSAPMDPSVYYHKNSPADVFMRTYTKEFKNVALIGLGGGALLCHAKSGQNWDVYDINPRMFEISGAKGTKFSYFSQCTPGAVEIIGDGRLEMAKQPDGKYDLIIIDVFTGFAIPTHFLTREAFKIYLSKLSPNGVILFHMNMIGMDLMPVFAKHIQDLGVEAKYMRETSIHKTGLLQTWLAVSKKPTDFLSYWNDVPKNKDTEKIEWTDDFSPIFPLLIW